MIIERELTRNTSWLRGQIKCNIQSSWLTATKKNLSYNMISKGKAKLKDRSQENKQKAHFPFRSYLHHFQIRNIETRSSLIWRWHTRSFIDHQIFETIWTWWMFCKWKKIFKYIAILFEVFGYTNCITNFITLNTISA